MSIFLPHSHSSKHTKYTGGGFTLIELLVVIAMISVLVSIVVVNVGAVQIKARDTQRLTDLETMQGAVEQYYRDVGHYPITKCATNGKDAYTGYGGFWGGKVICPTVDGNGTNVFGDEMKQYIPTPLKDPLGQGSRGDEGYLYRSDTGKTYCLMIWGTVENMNNVPSGMIDKNRCVAIGSDGKCTNDPGQNNIYYDSAGVSGC